MHARLSWTVPFLVVGLFTSPSQAQISQTQLSAVSPPGGQAGHTVEVTLSSGKDLDDASQLLFSHPGITSRPKLQESGGASVPVPNTFVVEVGADVPVGHYEVRTVGYFGVSNPRTFCVGDRPEIMEVESNNDPQSAQPLEFGTVVNGVCNGAADVDFYKLTASANQRILLVGEARRIDSRVQLQLELLDADGRRLQRSRGGYRGDPILDFTTPAEGDYFVRVTDFMYRGGIEYFYRLHLRTGPHIDFVLPPSGLPGTQEKYTLYGRNLPGGVPSGMQIQGVELEQLEVNIPLPAESQGVASLENLAPEESVVDCYSYRLDSPAGASNAVLIHFADAPVTLEQEPNNDAANAQKLTIPVEVGGQFQNKLDQDVFEFEARGGEIYFVEVHGQRLGMETDPRFVVQQITKNDNGEEQVKQLVDQDDERNSIGGDDFNTRHRDPAWKFAVPADGTYRVILSDRYWETRGNPGLVYRLVIRKESPDFRLVAFASQPNPQANQPGQPGVLSLRKGENGQIDVFAHRIDGFEGPIFVNVEGLPAGVTCRGAVIGDKQTAARLIVSAGADAAVTTANLRVIGEASIENPEIVRRLDAAEKAVKPAVDAIPNLQKAVEQTAPKLAQAEQKRDAARKAAEEKPDDENLKKQLAAAEEELQKEQQAHDAARAKLDEGNQAVAAARQQVQQALEAVRQSARQVKHPARTATLVWPGVPNAGAETVSRMTRNLALSVMDATAAFQAHLVPPEPKIVVHQSAQVLLPVKVEKRNNFDENVNLTFSGFDNNSKLQVENKPLNKGEAEGLRRVFVPKDAPPGAYTIYLNAQAQESYERNPKAIAEAKAGQEQAEADLKAAETNNKQAAETLAKANTEAQQAEAKAKQAAQTLQASEKAQQDAQAATTKAEQEVKTAQETLAKADEELKSKTEEDQIKAAQDAKAKAEAELKAKQEAHEKAKAVLTTKTEERAKAAAELKTAETELTQANEAKTKADADVKARAEALKTAQAAKAAADKRLQDVTNVNKAKNVNLTVPSTPVMLIIKEAPAEIAANVPGGGNLKRGETMEAKVTISRKVGFDGPVNVTLVLPPGVGGVRAEPLTIPADQSEGVLKITAGEESPEGKLENVVIRGEMEYRGKASIDVSVTLNLTQ
jgi:hypothetical protein